MNFCTANINGRGCNQSIIISFLIAYAKKWGLEYYVPEKMTNGVDPVYFPEFKVLPENLKKEIKKRYSEPLDSNKQPFYHEIPYMENVCFEGWYQSMLYLNPAREEILEAFKFEWIPNEYVSIHVRRTDYITYSANFPPITIEYIKKAIKYFNDLGYNKFKVFSDDKKWVRENINNNTFKDSEFIYSLNPNDVKGARKDIEEMSSCQHHIIANSSFSLFSSWLNQNESKIILSPSEKNLFKGANRDMLKGFDNLIKIEF